MTNLKEIEIVVCPECIKGGLQNLPKPGTKYTTVQCSIHAILSGKIVRILSHPTPLPTATEQPKQHV